MTFTEDPSIANEDWRLQAVTTTTAAVTLRYHHPAGTRVKAVAEVEQGRARPNLVFGIPNISALLLDYAQKMYDASEAYFVTLTPGVDGKVNLDQAEGPLFEALETRMGCIVFSFTAVEAYCNEKILEAYEHHGFIYHRQETAGPTAMTRPEIERRSSLEEKLHTILPQILGIRSPKGRALWSAYRHIKKIRDRIIHCKRDDLIGSGPRDSTLWRELASMSFPRAPKGARDLIGYYEANSPSERRWFAKCLL